MKLEVAKFRIMNKSPFFGTILYNLPVIEDTKIPTLGVDGESLFYNPKFWNSLKASEQMGVLMHEAGHLFLGHIWRRKNRNEIAVDPTTGQTVSLFNLAGDLVINLMIKEDSRFDLPKNCPLEQKYSGWFTEQVYEDLLKTIPKATPQQMKDLIKNGFCDKSKWKKGKGAGKAKEQEAKWENITKQALENAKAKGQLPSLLKRLYDKLQPKEDWRALLRDYVQPFSDDYSFSPADRRFLDEPFILPDIIDGQKIDYIVVAVDTSGSIEETQLSHFIAEIRGIMASYDKVKVLLTFCDAKASPFVSLEEFEDEKIKPTGGGGTDFNPVFDLIKKEETPPKALFYFTDLFGDFPKKAPLDYDVIWVSTNEQGKAPFGKTLSYGEHLK